MALTEVDVIKIIVRLAREYNAVIPAVCKKRIANEVVVLANAGSRTAAVRNVKLKPDVA